MSEWGGPRTSVRKRTDARALSLPFPNKTERELEWMVSIRVAVPVPPLLVALNVTVYLPAAVGVPEIKPVAVSTDKPAGKPVAP